MEQMNFYKLKERSEDKEIKLVHEDEIPSYVMFFLLGFRSLKMYVRDGRLVIAQLYTKFRSKFLIGMVVH